MPPLLMFDVMGTVVDVDGSIQRETRRILAPLGFTADRADRLGEAVGVELQKSIDAIVEGSAAWQGHRSLRERAWQRAAPDVAVAARAALTSVVERLDPWPDSSFALRRLRSRCQVVALSNADSDELAALSAHGDLAWHAMLSAEVARTYKPAPAVYLQAAERMGGEPEQITMVAAHPWDLRAAAAVGLRTAYVRRPGAEPPADDDAFDITVDGLAGLADRLT